MQDINTSSDCCEQGQSSRQNESSSGQFRSSSRQFVEPGQQNDFGDGQHRRSSGQPELVSRQVAEHGRQIGYADGQDLRISGQPDKVCRQDGEPGQHIEFVDGHGVPSSRQPDGVGRQQCPNSIQPGNQWGDDDDGGVDDDDEEVDGHGEQSGKTTGDGTNATLGQEGSQNVEVEGHHRESPCTKFVLIPDDFVGREFDHGEPNREIDDASADAEVYITHSDAQIDAAGGVGEEEVGDEIADTNVYFSPDEVKQYPIHLAR